ncbi:60S ribosomal protein L36 [Rhynchospora pubera]|nr:60S ribosomal protein L36 [Rhynchospora pubera]
MAYQENNGWPLGLRTLDYRAGWIRNRDFSSSVSFSTLFTASDRLSSVSSTDYGSEQSILSVSNNRNRTLGSLIGIASVLELSNRPINLGSTTSKRSLKIKDLFSLCFRNDIDVNSVAQAPSLRRFLEMERSANNAHRRTISDYLRV